MCIYQFEKGDSLMKVITVKTNLKAQKSALTYLKKPWTMEQKHLDLLQVQLQ